MVLDRRPTVTGEERPRVLRQPAEAPAPLPLLQDRPPLQALRSEWKQQLERAGARLPLRERARRWAGQISGRSDRRLLFALAQATDALATHCDEMAARLSSQGAVLEDIATAYGEDLTRLRAEIRVLTDLVSSFERPRE
jgi:ABC-type branched-subunit amino acid transport system ATPase component